RAGILITADLAQVECLDELRVAVGETAPKPILRLTRRERMRGYYESDRFDAALSFEYGSSEVDATTAGDVVFERVARTGWRRDHAAERAAVARLQELGVRRLADWQGGGTRLERAANAAPTV